MKSGIKSEAAAEETAAIVGGRLDDAADEALEVFILKAGGVDRVIGRRAALFEDLDVAP